MKSTGDYLKDLRQQQNISLKDLSAKTKIRLDYLEAIESGKYNQLPSATFVKGFIRNYALALNSDPEKALAIFRRDFDQDQQGKVVPRGMSDPIATKGNFWSPRTTVILGSMVLFIIAAMYIGHQLLTLVSAPNISINEPKEGQEYSTHDVHVSGKTRTDALLRVNSQPLILESNGEFETTLNLSSGEHTILIEAESRDGKIREVTRNIRVTAP